MLYQKIKKVLFIVADILLVLGCICMIAFLIIPAAGASLNIEGYGVVFKYVSFFLSLLILLVTAIDPIRVYIRKEKALFLIAGIALAIIYAVIRVHFLSNCFPFEDIGTSGILVISILLFFKK